MTNTTKTALIALPLAIIASIAMAPQVHQETAKSPLEIAASIVMTDCATEDSTNCFWDADSRGNGEGHSFVDIEGVAYYLD